MFYPVADNKAIIMCSITKVNIIFRKKTLDSFIVK